MNDRHALSILPKTDWADLILRTGGLMSPQECDQLALYAKGATQGVALEIGHYTGLSTCVLLQNLPFAIPLVTIDSHLWRDVPTETFWSTVSPHVHGRGFEAVYGRFEDQSFDGPYSFVFYDANHNATSCRAFWREISDKFADDAVLLYDDADWESMNLLGELATAAGFEDITFLPFSRHVIPYSTGDWQCDLDLGKRHPDTYTLRAMQRSNKT